MCFILVAAILLIGGVFYELMHYALLIVAKNTAILSTYLTEGCSGVGWQEGLYMHHRAQGNIA
jgi:hypothetical protein